MKIDAQMVNPTTYTSRISTDIPLYEIPGVNLHFLLLSLSLCGDEFDQFWNVQASFDEYLEDKPRVFQAIFPDKRRSDQINQVFSLNFFPFILGYKFGKLDTFITSLQFINSGR